MLYYQKKNQNAKRFPIIALHGFTGIGSSFSFLGDYLKEHPLILPDLPGHGDSSCLDKKDFSMKKTVNQIQQLLNDEGRLEAVICGYSMGGRIAIGFAEQFPNNVRGLVLMSTSPGIASERERQLRRKRDHILAGEIEAKGIHHFVDYWENLPLFDTQKKLPLKVQSQMKKVRLSQNPSGLATSLRQIGTGNQRSYWPSLPSFHFPVLILTGEWDKKFEEIANQMTKNLPHAVHKKIAQAGHALWLEQPEETAYAIKKWLNTSF